MTANNGRPLETLGHQPTLDGLRGIAVILVILLHAQPFFGWALGAGGRIGVDLFFVLSGFLITTLLLERPGESLWLFYRRRALRLLPALTLLMIVTIAVVAAAAPRMLGETIRSAGAVMAYLTNWSIVPTVEPFEHLWSLAVEEQFYLVWPLILVAAMNRGMSQRRLAFALLVLIAGVAVWRVAAFGMFGEVVYERTDTRIDGPLIGAVVALTRPTLQRWSTAVASSIGTLAMVVFLAAGLGLDGTIYPLGGFTVVGFLCAIVIVAALDPRWSARPLLQARWLVATGRWSYSLYLWHFPVFGIVRTWGPSSSVARVLLASAGTGVAVWLTYNCVEQPFLRWKRRLDADTSAGTTTAVTPDPIPA